MEKGPKKIPIIQFESIVKFKTEPLFAIKIKNMHLDILFFETYETT